MATNTNNSQSASGPPEASLTWNNGQEGRSFTISEDNLLLEYIMDSSGAPVAGPLSNLKLKVNPQTSITAILVEDQNNNISIRVYFQDPQGNLNEYAGPDHWAKGMDPFPAAVGTYIAAVTWVVENVGMYIRIYYQMPRSNALADWRFDPNKHGWYTGTARPGCKVTVLDWHDSSLQNPNLQVNWQTIPTNILGSRYISKAVGWVSNDTIVGNFPSADAI